MTAGHRNQGRTCPKGSARDAPSLLGGARSFLGGDPSDLLGGPSFLLGAPGVWLGAWPDELGTRGFLLGTPSSGLGECTSAGRERPRELGVCLNLLGSCPKKTGAPGFSGSGRAFARTPMPRPKAGQKNPSHFQLRPGRCPVGKGHVISGWIDGAQPHRQRTTPPVQGRRHLFQEQAGNSDDPTRKYWLTVFQNQT